MLAPAKINLMLHVTGRRDDGYHLLQSLVVFATQGDTLTAEPSDECSLTIDGAFAHGLDTENNLVMRAARTLAEHHAIAPRARLHLTKNLPVGAGLGGGSADAAAALRLLDALWARHTSEHVLHRLAATLGSDVPACLSAAPCWMEGTGHELTPITLTARLSVVLVNPGSALQTADVYGALSAPYDPPIQRPDSFHSTFELIAFLLETDNTLEAASCRLEPKIHTVLHALRATERCALARMSGSGATCFALYADASDARTAAAHIQAAHPEWWVLATSIGGHDGQA